MRVRCLAKDPDDRYGSTRDLARDLQRIRDTVTQIGRVSVPSAGATKSRWSAAIGLLVAAALIVGLFGMVAPSIRETISARLAVPLLPVEKQVAVLPFANVGNDPTNQPLCDGLMEMLTSQLSQLEQFQRALQVVPASEIRREGVASAREARRTFGVTLAITGSVQRTAERLRLTINVVDAKTLRQLNARSLDTELRDVSVMQDGVVLTVAELLNVKLPPQAKQLLTAGGTTIPGAYDSYLQGKGYLQRFEKLENVDQAVGLFRRALDRDPTYALAYAALGEAYWRKYELTKDSQWVDTARKQCQAAIRLTNTLAPVYVTLGLIDTGSGRYQEAIGQVQRALEIDPVNGDAYRELAKAQEALGRTSEAEATYKKAIEVRPSFWASHNALGAFYYRLARYREAEMAFRRVIELTPDNARAYSNLGGIYYFLKRYDQAAAMLERSVAIKPNDRAYSNLGTVYFSLGRYSDAARTFERALSIHNGDYQVWHNLAAAYYWAPHERDKARPAYERAITMAEAERRVNPRRAALLMDLADCYSMIGQRRHARDLLRQALRLAPKEVANLAKAGTTYEQLGDRQLALEWIGKALHQGYSRDLVERSPSLAQLRADPRFNDLQRLAAGTTPGKED